MPFEFSGCDAMEWLKTGATLASHYFSEIRWHDSHFSLREAKMVQNALVNCDWSKFPLMGVVSKL